MIDKKLLKNLYSILEGYEKGLLGDQSMPEDSHPKFKTQEENLAYFTLPMALNYQRNSYTLWESALKTWLDTDTQWVFNVEQVSKSSEEDLRKALLKYKVALQPNKHINTWKRISETIYNDFKDISTLLEVSNYNFLKLRENIQVKYKKGFPYLSGPKIFNYWSFILERYCDIKFKNREYMNIAPDTHVVQSSIRLGVLSEEEGKNLSRDEIADRWRKLLKGTDIAPSDLHSPFWFWSRNNFQFQISE